MTPHLIALVAIAGAVPSTQQNQDIGQTIREAVGQATREASQDAQQAAREATQEAQQAAREAQQQMREAQQQVREAQQQVRDAQQQLREARTPDQQGAAHQAMMAAQEALTAAQAELQGQIQSPRVIYTSQPPFFPQPTIPPQAVDIAIGFFVTCVVIVVGWPISRALGRRFEKRGTTPLLDASVADQLQRIEQAVEAVAIEVERVSESQRFLARLQEKTPSTVE